MDDPVLGAGLLQRGAQPHAEQVSGLRGQLRPAGGPRARGLELQLRPGAPSFYQQLSSSVYCLYTLSPAPYCMGNLPWGLTLTSCILTHRWCSSDTAALCACVDTGEVYQTACVVLS